MRKNTYYARLDSNEFNDTIYNITFDCVEKRYHEGLVVNEHNFLEIRSAHILLSLKREQFPSHIKSFKHECWYEISITVDSEDTTSLDALICHFHTESHTKKIKISSLKEMKKRSKKSKELSSLYQLKNITGYAESITSEENLIGLLPTSTIKEDFWLRVVNVGQGSCNSLSIIEESAGIETQPKAEILYLALGGGVLANASTYGCKANFYPVDNAPVILCHWDMDHWISGEQINTLNQTQWIVPEQKNLGITHLKFAQRLSNERRLHIWPRGLKKVKTCLVDIYKLPENKNRNYSGLVSIVKSSKRGNKNTIYPGDAPFSKCKDFISEYDIAAIITPHHAGDMPFKAIPKAPEKHVVISSFGIRNTFNHPFEGNKNKPISTKEHYSNKGWKNWHTTENGDQLIYNGTFLEQTQLELQELNRIKPNIV